jgi:NAD(P)-dependent dehydrogenase (short-subunit alcohol dehydrogenase family)
MNDFEGLVALVTGGASGIGAATAAQLAARGARVAVLDLDPTGGPSGGSTGASAGVFGVACDVADRAAVDAAIDAVVQRFGRLDVVVNNAGIGASGTVADHDDDEWTRLLDVNVIGMARVARAALPHLRRSEHAAIVNVCSAVAFVGVRGRALYSASKGAVLALTLAMAADHVQEGIRVNAVAPGTTATPWVDRLLAGADDPEDAAAKLRARQPLGRLVTTDEVATAIVNLASPTAASTTGAVLRVDGGMAGLRL